MAINHEPTSERPPSPEAQLKHRTQELIRHYDQALTYAYVPGPEPQKSIKLDVIPGPLWNQRTSQLGLKLNEYRSRLTETLEAHPDSSLAQINSSTKITHDLLAILLTAHNTVYYHVIKRTYQDLGENCPPEVLQRAWGVIDEYVRYGYSGGKFLPSLP